MAKSIQRPLDLPVQSSSGGKKISDKRLKVMGRPRRLRSEFNMTAPMWISVKESLDKGLTPEEAVSGYASSPGIIKVSIPLPMLNALDRVRRKIEGNATQPDVIRIAVERLISSFRGDINDYNARAHVSAAGKLLLLDLTPPSKGRCVYIKVLFEPSAIAEIGHSASAGRSDSGGRVEATGLCAKLSCGRQDAIKVAIMMYLESVR